MTTAAVVVVVALPETTTIGVVSVVTEDKTTALAVLAIVAVVVLVMGVVETFCRFPNSCTCCLKRLDSTLP